MLVRTERLSLTKRYPLTISRGTITGSVNVLVRVDHDGIVGWGEGAPNDVSGDSTASIENDVARLGERVAHLAPFELQAVTRTLGDEPFGRAAFAAFDIACHDWWGRRMGVPLWRLLGVEHRRVPYTSLTIGMAAPEELRERVPEVLARTGARALKVKLGGAAGIDADRDMFAAVQESAANSDHGMGVALRVDANGGWSADDAITLDGWLADRGVEYIEQPLPVAMDGELARLMPRLRLPVYLDESIRVAADVARLHAAVAGVNLKLMKCGGVAEALRLINVARARGMKVMIGCMGESTLAITAGAHVAPLVDHVDLDSHFNLVDDPFLGARMISGRVVAPDGPGLGVTRRADSTIGAKP